MGGDVLQSRKEGDELVKIAGELFERGGLKREKPLDLCCLWLETLA
jgi:hypothetical protein